MAKSKPGLDIDCTYVRAGERVCVAVSGGADSVALLLELHELNARKEPLGIVLSAVHVHHGLRGAEADADEAFVRELCERLGLPLSVERVDVARRQAAEREGTEEAARELRYGVFWALMADGQADAIATAHTLDDQAETVVMKLLRGAWTEGIGGIAPLVHGQVSKGQRAKEEVPISAVSIGARQSPGGWPLALGPCIIRPMLGVRRAEVEGFLLARGQGWREDATNRDTSLMRNRVRHELMPMLRSFNPGIDAALERLAEIARDEEAFWQGEVARVLPQLLLPGKPVRGGGRAVGTAATGGACAVEIERLRALVPGMQRRLLRAAARSLGCRISAEETTKLLGLAGLGARRGASAGRIGARLELAHGLRAERTARELQLAVATGPFVGKEKRGKTAGAEPPRE